MIGTSTAPFGIIRNEPEHVYRNSGCIGSTDISIFHRNPRLFWGLKVAQCYPRTERLAFTLGRALHCLVLEGLEQFNERFTTGCPVNPRTSKPFGRDTNAFAEWAKSMAPREVLAEEDHALLLNMANSIAENKRAQDLLDVAEEREVTFRPQERWHGIAVQCRTDAVGLDNIEPSLVVDLKTTESLEKFERTFFSLGYHRQAAFYTAVVEMCASSRDIDFVFIAVEKEPPYGVGIYRLDEATLDHAHLECESALRRMRLCLETNDWPRDEVEERVLKLPMWYKKGELAPEAPLF